MTQDEQDRIQLLREAYFKAEAKAKAAKLAKRKGQIDSASTARREHLFDECVFAEAKAEVAWCAWIKSRRSAGLPDEETLLERVSEYEDGGPQQ